MSADLSGAFISAVREHIPEAALIFDHFHVVKLSNDALDKVRAGTYKSLDTKEFPYEVHYRHYCLCPLAYD